MHAGADLEGGAKPSSGSRGLGAHTVKNGEFHNSLSGCIAYIQLLAIPLGISGAPLTPYGSFVQ